MATPELRVRRERQLSVEEYDPDAKFATKKMTSADARDMQRMGKVQEMKVCNCFSSFTNLKSNSSSVTQCNAIVLPLEI